MLTAYLRVLARGTIGDGMAVPARGLLAHMGALASPSTEACPAAVDDGFATVQAQLAAQPA